MAIRPLWKSSQVSYWALRGVVIVVQEAAGEAARKAAEERGEGSGEIGGPKGLEPTRYGDWEHKGRCVDF